MTFVDAGPLFALIDANESDHARCRATLATLQPPMPTSWAVYTEAMYLLGRSLGHSGQAKLWDFLTSGLVELIDLSPEAVERCRVLMAKYADLPMDLADATLVALAEERDDDEIFTLDDDFTVYRLYGRRRFKILPS